MDTAIGVVSNICGLLAPPIFEQLGYIVFCESNANELKEKIKKFKAIKVRVEHRIEESTATSPGEVTEADVSLWLENAEKRINEATQILETNKVRWSLGFIPITPKICYKLGKDAKKFIKDFDEAVKEIDVVEKFTYRPSYMVGAVTSSKSNIVALKLQNSVLQSVMKALDDDNIRVIGVCGLGGISKTTLFAEVEKMAKDSHKFGEVVSVVFSKVPDFPEIKCKIGKAVKRLRSGKSTRMLLILMDDLRKVVKLNDIGVPEKHHNLKIKLVMRSRDEYLLTIMECERIFHLDVLDEGKDWQFFAELVGRNVEDLKGIPTAVRLLNKCGGLPLSIEALARLMKKKTDASGSSSDLLISLSELEHYAKESHASVYIEWSYKDLGDSYEGKQAKELFKIIGFLGNPNVSVHTLLQYCVGLGLFDSDIKDNFMERARRELNRSLRALQESNLLLESDDRDHVKMHDIVLDVASMIATKEYHALTYDRDLSRKQLKKCKALSLPAWDLQHVHDRWDLPNVNILVSEGDQDLSRQKEGRCHVQLPSSFQKGMVKLKVFDLRHAWLTSLPSSIQSDLCNLTTLFLHFCCIENVSVIGNLKSLQILSFVGSDLAYLPKEIGDLAKLRMLDLSKCSELKTIEPGTLERLTQLEELYIKESFKGWEVEGAEQPNNSSLAELNHLPRLRTLEVCVPDTNSLPQSLPLGDLVCYKVLIGDSWDWSGEYRESRTLKFKENSKKSILTEDWLQSALQTTEDLYLDGLTGAGGSFHLQCKERFKELKHLHLQNSSSIQYVIWSTEWLACSAFTTLESMILEKMDSLEKICHGFISPTSFNKLKVLRIEKCHKLTNLFNLSLVDSLTELEEIEVSDCRELTEIVTTDKEIEDDDGTEDEDHKEGMKRYPNNLCGCPIKRSKGMVRAPYVIKLGNLRCLILRNLPKLRTFFGNEALSESMKTTGHVLLNDQKGALHSCKRKKLMPAFRHKEIPLNTHVLELDKLQRLELADCDGIAHFLSSGMLLKLVNLESLSIAGCKSLEDIFDLNEVDAASRNVEILPRLFELKLRGLPKLVHIWKKNDMLIKGCQSLRTVEIYQCNSLMYLCSSSMCECMANLTEILVRRCKNMEAVFVEKGPTNNASSFTTGLRSLKTLVILHCPNLKAFLSEISMGLNVVESSTTSNDNKKGIPYCCCGKQVDDLADTSCFFNQKVFLPDLESLVISWGGDFENLWCSEVPAKSYCKLEFIHIEYCQNLLTVFPATLIERLQKLKQLFVNHCEKLKTVINLVDDWETSKKKPKSLMLPQLQKLELKSLDRLRHIIETNSTNEIVVGFPNLKRVEVLECNELTHLIPSATATTLLKLEEMDIRRCGELKEVVYGGVSERNKMNDFITFRHLTSLTMTELYSLICFCSEGYSFDFTCLKDLTIRMCTYFIGLVKSRSDCANTGTQALFNDKVRLPNLESLDISYCESVEGLWSEEPPTGSFCKLQKLCIWTCPGLRDIIPSFVLYRLQVLETMRIHECGTHVEDIFNITSTQQNLLVDDSENSVLEGRTVEESTKEGRYTTERIVIIALTKLTTLKLGRNVKLGDLLSGHYILELPSLKNLILDSTPAKTTTTILEKVHFPNVEELDVYGIEDLWALWHSEPSIGSFNKLKTLEVRRCSKLIKVIPLFMLKKLQNLENLKVEACDSLETVCELGVGGGLDKHIEETAGSELAWNLTAVSVMNCESLRILFSFSGRHHENEKATIDDSTNNIIVLPQLNHLRLENLPKLEHLFHVLHGQYILQLPSLKDFSLIEAGAKETVIQKVLFSEELKIHEHDDISFFGSTSSVMIQLMEALQNNRNNQTIIGLLGYDRYLIAELERQVKEEADLFDEVVVLWSGNDAKSIQEELGKKLGIIYGTTEEQGRAESLENSLLSNRHKRLLFILGVEETMDLEAVGIPCRQRLDPRFFKQILISEKDREVLDEMGAHLVIDIGDSIGDRYTIFEEELIKRDSEEPQVDTTNDISFIVGSKTSEDIFWGIVGALISHPNDQIIGILGSYNQRLFVQISYSLKYEYKYFDEVVDLYGKNNADNIQERLGSILGITYDGISGITQRARLLRQSLSTNSEKRLLLIIAIDLEEDLNLEAVGVLDPKLFNIMLVSEKREVLHHMGAQSVNEIGDISHLWWFQTIADECGCNYLARLLARKLKGKGLPEWKYALQRLKDSPFEYEAREKVVDSLFVSDGDDDEESQESGGGFPLVTGQAKAGQAIASTSNS